MTVCILILSNDICSNGISYLFIYVTLLNISKLQLSGSYKANRPFSWPYLQLVVINLPEVALGNCKSTWCVRNWHWWSGWWSLLLCNVPRDKYQHV